MTAIQDVVVDLMGREEPEPTGRLAELMADPWLREKLRRDRRLREHGDYLERFVPWIADVEPGLVIDIGPGGGELLEICRELGHEVFAIDAATGKGGMGAAYLEASRILLDAKGIPVDDDGLLSIVRTCEDWAVNAVVLMNSRGSLEQVFSDYMDGPPHDEHHVASKMTWRLGDKMTETAMRRMMNWTAFQLRPGGVFLCHLNGSTNTERAELDLDMQAIKAGLQAEYVEPKIHRWIKPEAIDEREEATDILGG